MSRKPMVWKKGWNRFTEQDYAEAKGSPAVGPPEFWANLCFAVFD
jgi:hypothetical protein